MTRASEPAAGDQSLAASNLLFESYLALIAEIACIVGVISPETASPHQEDLLRIRSRLAFAGDVQTLRETRDALENELRLYAERTRALLERRADDLRRLLKAFSQVTEILAERNHVSTQKFTQFSGLVQEIANAVPWMNVREALGEIIADVRTQVDVLHLDGQLAQAHLEEQMRAFQSRLDTGNPHHLDSLTGVGNRRGIEQQITRHMEAGRAFTLLLFETTGLETQPRVVVDQVLVQAASRLVGQVRAHDYVGRWSANEFAVVMECPLDIAWSRSEQIARWLSGPYILRGSEGGVEVTFTVRAVDPPPSTVSSAVSGNVSETASAPLPG